MIEFVRNEVLFFFRLLGYFLQYLYFFFNFLFYIRVKASQVKNLPRQEPWETPMQSLGGEDPLEEEMATHSSTLAWEIPWTEGPGGLQSMGSQRVGHD